MDGAPAHVVVPASQPQAVGTKQPNDWSLYDLSGNVLEWTYDWFDGNYYASSPSLNPSGPVSGTKRVYRGGSWSSNNAPELRVSDRDSVEPDYTNNFLGFRLVRSQQ